MSDCVSIVIRTHTIWKTLAFIGFVDARNLRVYFPLLKPIHFSPDYYTSKLSNMKKLNRNVTSYFLSVHFHDDHRHRFTCLLSKTALLCIHRTWTRLVPFRNNCVRFCITHMIIIREFCQTWKKHNLNNCVLMFAPTIILEKRQTWKKKIERGSFRLCFWVYADCAITTIPTIAQKVGESGIFCPYSTQ